MNPPNIAQGIAAVVENVPLAESTFRLRFLFPPLAERIRPGQFLMLRIPGKTDPLLGRAFALYDTVLDKNGKPEGVDVVYLVIGKMTGLMAEMKPGEEVEIWGPLGNGFPDYSGVKHLIMAAGGIGQTPFLALIHRVLGKRGYGKTAAGREVEQVSLYYGVRTKELLAGVEDFERAGADTHVATDDGSDGFQGTVTQLLDSRHSIPGAHLRLAGCGPEPMLHALAELAERWNVPCDLSLETPMACGVGVCFSCVTKVKTETSWDYRRVCVDGPVFPATSLVW